MMQPKFYIKEWFYAMSRERKKMIKESYVRHYNIRFPNQFYSELTSRNMSAEKLQFFSTNFACSLDDLLKPPAEPILHPFRSN